MGKLNYRIPNTNDFREIYVKVTDTLPIGAVCQYGGSTAPSGYLMCNGQAVSRTTYADLFKAIGTSFGSGDGVTTFNVPNFNGRVPVGLDGTQTEFDTLGEIGGSKYLQEHSHNFVRAPLYGAEWSGDQSVLAQNTLTGPSIVGTTNNAGTGDSGNLQPYTVTNFIIKASKKVALDKGNVVDSLNGSDADSAPSVRAIKEAFQTKGTILWTNPNPTSAFAEQDINLSTDDFDLYYVVAKTWSGATNLAISSLTPKQFNAMIYYNESTTNYIRFCNSPSGKIMHINASSGANAYCVPIYVIGYKTGLFS